MEFGESNEAAAVREAKEETGLDIPAACVTFGGVTNDFFQESNKHYITLNLLATEFHGKPQVMEPDKFEKWQWFALDNLPANLFLPCQKFLENYPL